MAESTWAALLWSARSATQGTPNGRFSCFPGFGIYTRRMFGAWYPWRWTDWSIASIQSPKFSFASGTVCPSTPGAESFGIWHRFSQTLSFVMWWANDVNRSFGSHRAFAAIRSSPVAMAGGSSLCIEGRILPLYGAHVSVEPFDFRWPLPHVVGSPNRRVLSASLTSIRSSGLPCLVGLSDPTSYAWTWWLSLVPMESFDCMPAVRTPEASQSTCLNASWDSAFPTEA